MNTNKEKKITIIDLFKMLFSRNREQYEEIDFGITKRTQLAEKFPVLKKVAESFWFMGIIAIGSGTMAITIIIVFFMPLSLLPTPEKYEFYLFSYSTLFIFQIIKFLTRLFDPEVHFVGLVDLYLFLSRIAIIIIIIVLIGPDHSIFGWVDSILKLITKLFGGM